MGMEQNIRLFNKVVRYSINNYTYILILFLYAAVYYIYTRYDISIAIITQENSALKWAFVGSFKTNSHPGDIVLDVCEKLCAFPGNSCCGQFEQRVEKDENSIRNRDEL